MSLKYLATILIHPRETMRRILDSPNRWSMQVVALAAICASFVDFNSAEVARELPGLKLTPGLALVVISLVAQAIGWMLVLLIVAAIALPIGRYLLGGKATFRDIVAALAWGLVPQIWSLVYRVPGAILASGLHVAPGTNAHKVIFDFLSHGGCSLIVVYLFLQVVFEIACVVLGSFTLAEAQGFSTQKGFVNVIGALIFPVVVILAAVFSLRS